MKTTLLAIEPRYKKQGLPFKDVDVTALRNTFHNKTREEYIEKQ